MRFQLEVDLDKVTGEPFEQLSRILRYWAANLKHFPLEVGSGFDVWDEVAAVGRWRYVDGEDTDATEQ